MSFVKKQFLNHFKSHNHLIIPSYSLIPQNDPSLLLINAGMAPMKRMFLGTMEPPHSRIANAQKCIRAGGKHNDLDEVGYTKRHHTFFEMLGNFSFGDYFKEEAINMAWDFLTNGLNIPKDKLYITIHPSDQESKKIWLSIGILEENIINETENIWSSGEEGPCGVCTEIFYDHGKHIEGDFHTGDRFVEIWNIVFMTDTVENGIKRPLAKPCVDAGMGLERLEALISGTNDNYEAPFFKNMINIISKNDTSNINNRVIADHSRAITFMIDDGVTPSADGVGYILRKIIRRAVRRSVNNNSVELCIDYIITNMSESYPTLSENKEKILNIFSEEKQQFLTVYHNGLERLNHMIAKNIITETKIFELYDTHGFPYDIAFEILREHKIKYDFDKFTQCMLKQKNISKLKKHHIQSSNRNTEFVGYEYESAECEILECQNSIIKEQESGFMLLDKTPFYVEAGGQKNDTGFITTENGTFEVEDIQKENNEIWHIGKCIKGFISIGKGSATINSEKRKGLKQHHSATHILLAILRQKFGDSVLQKGSSVKEDSLRFDFSMQNLIDKKTLDEIESQVNKAIQSKLAVTTTLMSYEDALKTGALLTEKNYPQKVRVLQIGDISTELCCGTHVKNTSEIGQFFIKSHKSVAAGVKRIEAICGLAAKNHTNKSVETKKIQKSAKKPICIASENIKQSSYNILLQEYNNADTKYLLSKSDTYIQEHDIVILVNIAKKNSVFLRVKDNLIPQVGTAQNILSKLGAQGGGRNNIAQGSINEFDFKQIIDIIRKTI